MNNCNDAGTCNQYGFCECTGLARGADCAHTAVSFKAANSSSISVPTKGTQWFYLVHEPTSGQWSMSLRSNTSSSFSVYVGYGTDSNPDSYTYDAMYKDIAPGRTLTFTEQSLGLAPGTGFAAAVQVNGYLTGSNSALENLIEITLTEADDLEDDNISFPYFAGAPLILMRHILKRLDHELSYLTKWLNK